MLSPEARFAIVLVANALVFFVGIMATYYAMRYILAKEDYGRPHRWEDILAKLHAVHDAKHLAAGYAAETYFIVVPARGPRDYKTALDRFEEARRDWRHGRRRAIQLASTGVVTAVIFVFALGWGLIWAVLGVSGKQTHMTEILGFGWIQTSAAVVVAVFAFYGFYLNPIVRMWNSVQSYIHSHNQKHPDLRVINTFNITIPK